MLSGIVKEIVDTYWDVVRILPNVVGYSMELRERVRTINNVQVRIPHTAVFVVYVSDKVEERWLNLSHRIPATFELSSRDLIETDVIRIGLPKALADKTSRIRPVSLGLSIGNIVISAGSLGMLYTKEGEDYSGSNAHILTPNPSLPPSEVTSIQILQPGAAHGGANLENQVGEYFWHKQIIPAGTSPCSVGNLIAKGLNAFAHRLGRRGRFAYEDVIENRIDFAVYKPTVEHTLEVANGSLSNEPFIGHLYAGSDVSGIICKVSHIMNEGYIPKVPTAEVDMDDKVKGCSFWCNYETKVIDPAAAITISYGNFSAFFSDVILVSNNGTIKGGWSGSGFRVMKN